MRSADRRPWRTRNVAAALTVALLLAWAVAAGAAAALGGDAGLRGASVLAAVTSTSTATPTPTAGPSSTATATPSPSNTPTPTATATPASDPTPAPAPTSTTGPSPGWTRVGPAGAEVTAGPVSVRFPPGAVGQPVDVAIAPLLDLSGPGSARALIAFRLDVTDAAGGSAVTTFSRPLGISVKLAAPELGGARPEKLVLARLRQDAPWSALPSRVDAASLTAEAAESGTFAVLSHAPARPVDVTFDRETDAPAEGRHRVEPGGPLRVTVSMKPTGDIYAAVLFESIPPGWTVQDSGGATRSADSSQLIWQLGDVDAGAAITRDYTVIAPPFAAVARTARFQTRLVHEAGAVEGPAWSALVAPKVIVAHVTIGRIDRETGRADYGSEDSPLSGEPRFEVFRLRFQVRNADSTAAQWAPRLEYRPAGSGAFEPVPDRDPKLGVPFYAARERRVDSDDELIAPADVRMHERDDAEERPADGQRFTGPNPAPKLALPPRSYTEVEFSVRATADAAWLASYEFLLSDNGRPLPGAATATVALGPEPPVTLSPGQREGTWVAPGRGTAADPASGRHPLLAAAGPPAPPAPPSLLAAGAFTSPHGGYGAAADTCALCHRTHTGDNKNLLTYGEPQSNLCLSCHDGTGASSNVAGQYSDANVPANDSATSSFYSHAATTATSHTSALVNEFGGVLNRHSECGDCHNPHRASGAAPAMTSSGWTASGPLTGISGVTVTNGGAGTAPSYTWTTGISYEYQLCLKCHSGFTQLLSYTKQSYMKLDKGTELNPSNASYHPIEAPGTNTTTRMANSLAGTSPYKLWNFTTGSTVRCVSCHGDYRLAGSAPAAGAQLAPHTSQYRGLLMNNYRGRDLKPVAATNSYTASDFALCFQCHAEAPFVDTSGNQRTDTNFRFHGFHLSKIYDNPGGGGASTDIDTADAGQGNAICAECHYRIHSTTYGVSGVGNARLVNFAPNVQPNSMGQGPTWTYTAGNPDTGRCSLRCHGQNHGNYGY